MVQNHDYISARVPLSYISRACNSVVCDELRDSAKNVGRGELEKRESEIGTTRLQPTSNVTLDIEWIVVTVAPEPSDHFAT